MFPSDLTTTVLAKAIAGFDARNAALANNIANAETPGYARMDVSFEAALADAAEADRAALHSDPRLAEMPRRSGAGREIEGAGSTLRSVDTTVVRADGSNVDADDEMAKLAANQLAHQTVTALLDKRFSQVRMAVTGR